MTIKATRPGGDPGVPRPASYTMGDHGNSGVRYDHRRSPVENQGLMARMDEVKPSDSEYQEMLSRAREDGSGKWAGDDFERRIDSLNFPSDKSW